VLMVQRTSYSLFTPFTDTGDWVRVNGELGMVEVLRAQERIVMRVRDRS
jgi:hypothetical protein